MTGDEVRQAYLGFFEQRGHKIIPGSSLIPHGDPTLLLTSAGMVQFKPYFLGEAVPPGSRLASCQKCFRTTDIESVGDASHLTFFEMLGNFSIGDYFKEEAIGLALEFVIQRLELPPERLWITIFLDDDESFHIWRELGIPEDRILRFGEEDNFWGPAGDSGPCGPCSEIHYDFGPEAGCRQPSCAPNCQCGRFAEIWNLVFIQYNQDKEGQRTLLSKPSIDTGMGLERTAAVIQGKSSVYETDLFTPLIQLVSQLSGKKYGFDDNDDNSMRIVAEHSRGITFLVADGVLPDNEGRGYVLRRLLRRAALFGRRLGLEKPFLSQMAEATIDKMGPVYPELVNRRDFVLKVVELEEARFGETLDMGLEVMEGLLGYREDHRGAISELVPFLRDFRPASENAAKVLEQYGFVGGGWEKGRQLGAEIAAETISQLTYDFLEELEQAGGQLGDSAQELLVKVEHWDYEVSGDEVFKLYDTYGFPVELTQEIAQRQGFSVDMEGFEREMEKQRERARAAGPVLLDKKTITIHPKPMKTEFVGYQNLKQTSVILGLLVDNETVDSVKEGQQASLVLETTPFYAEMGGQVGDTGEIIGPSGKFVVTNTIQVPPDTIVHQGHVVQGGLNVGDEVEAKVDRERRLDIARNHTATHLLQFALRRVLGEHVQQRGSLVAPDRLRFDFSHLTAMTKEEIGEVQRIVNEKVRQNLPVYDQNIPYKQAIESGAIALFDEKYGDMVRVLKIGSPAISTELCGGTHVAATGEIGFFQILTESSIGGGLRRIEAVTGRRAEEVIKQKIGSLSDEAAGILAELEKESKRVQTLERELARRQAESLLGQVEVVEGVKVLAAGVSPSRPEMLREMADLLRDKLKSAVVVLGTIYEGKPAFIAAVTPDLVKKGYHAGEIIKKVAKVAGGGGGGKASLAQGGGKDKDKLDEALRLVRSLI